MQWLLLKAEISVSARLCTGRTDVQLTYDPSR